MVTADRLDEFVIEAVMSQALDATARRTPGASPQRLEGKRRAPRSGPCARSELAELAQMFGETETGPRSSIERLGRRLRGDGSNAERRLTSRRSSRIWEMPWPLLTASAQLWERQPISWQTGADPCRRGADRDRRLRSKPAWEPERRQDRVAAVRDLDRSRGQTTVAIVICSKYQAHGVPSTVCYGQQWRTNGGFRSCSRSSAHVRRV